MLARTINLELLRQGPSHNQLLSPLTPYLALCGHHEVETVHVGFEHADLLRRMRGLRYQDGKGAEVAAIEEASAEVTRLLSGIRSLAVEVGSVPRGRGAIIHLRLILSAAELAALPFELTRAPAGFPGAGQWLGLQTAVPISLTREVRRVASRTFAWPDRPRVLVVAAAPPGVAKVPLRAHLLALRAAFDPWLSGDAAAELQKVVTVLPDATLSAVREASARAAGEGRPFTHVHVLAHGVAAESTLDGVHGYGLALCSDDDPKAMDVVTGTRLAAALRCHPNGPIEDDLAGPVVVTMASCDSANGGSVIDTSAGIAHELHEAGIPLVLASQFPLSVKGSVVMTETVYNALLRGDDPRVLVHDLRQALHTSCPDTHDWASVVAYAALPHDIDQHVAKASMSRALLAVNAALSRRDYEARSGRPTEATMKDLRDSMGRLEATLPKRRAGRAARARVLGVIAAAGKRVAHAIHQGPLTPVLAAPATPTDAVAMLRASPSTADVARQAEARRVLDVARRQYLDVFRAGLGEAWPLVQYLALDAALSPPGAARADAHRAWANTWTAAWVVADDNLKSKSGRELAWASAALVELYVLAQLLPQDHWAKQEAGDGAYRHLEGVLAHGTALDGYSLRGQLQRYTGWWWRDMPALSALPRALEERLAGMGVGESYVEGA